MLRRRDINADPRRLPARIASAVADLARWPFERAAWFLEERLLWPLGDLLAGRAPSTRALGAGALGAVAVAALVGGALLLGGEEPAAEAERPTAEQTAAVAAEPPPATTKRPRKPTLQGVSPSFAVGGGPGAGKAAAKGGGASASQATGELNAGGAEPASTATLSSDPDAVPAGPAAMKVARRFAEAFVFYEVGERPQRAEAVFGETAMPRLAKALAARPPRQPAAAEVPKARVLNLVPGPRSGRAYTVSAALLRVGEISELRMELRKQRGEWLITDVRG